MKPLDPIAYDYSGLIAPKDAPPCVKQTGLVEEYCKPQFTKYLTEDFSRMKEVQP